MKEDRRRTVAAEWMGGLVDDVGRAVDGEAVPLLHGGAVDVFLRMLRQYISVYTSLYLLIGMKANARQRSARRWARPPGCRSFSAARA